MRVMVTAASVATMACALSALVAPANAQIGGDDQSGKLLLTGGVSQVEGAAGGGLTPWAIIGGYGTRDQIGGNAFYTHVETDDFALDSFGALVGINDRVEFSISQQQFNLKDLGSALGLGSNFKIDVTTYGAKVKLFGDAVLEQDSWIPQVAVGVQYKDNSEDALVESLGASSGDGTDFYVSATKLFLDQSLLLNGTVRFTKANQLGILGHGSVGDDDYKAQFEGSAAYLLTRNIAIGAEVRTKPDNLAGLKEDTAYDAFIAWAPTKNISATLAYTDLGNIVVGDQRGVYASVQVGF